MSSMKNGGVVRRELGDVILTSVGRALAQQRPDGSFPEGHNGPYRDPETPVRNTAHWTVALLRSYLWHGDERLRAVAVDALRYLKSTAARPMNASFWCRKSPEKDFCNGLVGQAWAIEALAEAGTVIDDDEALAVAHRVFAMHPFDEGRAAWRTVHVDGHYGDFDPTFNHQLWFAAAGGLLVARGSADIGARVRRFLDALPGHLVLYRDGLIRHGTPFFLARTPAELALASARAVHRLGGRRGLHAKSIGYHAFNTYALALLKESFPDHSVWSDPGVRKAVAHVRTGRYRERVETAPYGLEYNPPGLEAAYTISVFEPDATDEVQDWLEWQLARTLDGPSGHMVARSADPSTSAARIYEATRLAFDTALSLEA